MEYSDSYLREHLPRDNPPSEQVSIDVEDEIQRWSDSMKDEGELIARATRWTYAVFSELGLGRFELERPFYSRAPEYFPPASDILARDVDGVSFGLFDWQSERAGLGIIIDVPRWPGPTFQIVDYATFSRLGGARFPVAIRQSEVDLHLSHPAGATSACWAQCKINSSLWGILTAGHAVPGSRAGRTVPLGAGGSGTLVRSYYQPVDAAFVQTTPPSYSLAPLSILAFPAMGLPVSVECQSGSVTRTIVEVTNNCGVLHTRSLGVMIYLDTPTKAGDSGALVLAASGDAVGIYKGSLNVPTAPTGQRGLAQNFEQAAFALDIIPYL